MTTQPTTEAYPLCWPHGRPRTPAWNRSPSAFDVTFARARDDVQREVEMLCGKYAHMRKEANLIISTNIPLRKDGLPLAGQRKPDDAGVAVYFTHKKKQMCFACDRWNKIEDNMRAIAKTIEALRGIARWGTGDMMEAAFTGFAALPAPTPMGQHWTDVLEVNSDCSLATAELNYKRLRSDHHPDHGGDPHRFDAVQKAWEQGQREIRR